MYMGHIFLLCYWLHSVMFWQRLDCHSDVIRAQHYCVIDFSTTTKRYFILDGGFGSAFMDRVRS